jgi:hypothetical protein
MEFTEIFNLKNLREARDRQIATVLSEHPEMTHEQVAQIFGCTRRWIIAVAKKFNITRPHGRPKKAV